uniref:Uncharacterized protein n=1 Tax=Syphacia muris TaxID=451379 RepID=A0A0N5AE42_9BILA
MIRICGLLSLVLISECICGIHTVAAGKTIRKKAVENDLQCFLSNLKKVIGNNGFSIVGKRSDCKFIYFTDKDMDKAEFNLNLNVNITNPVCDKPYRPMFYTKSPGSEYALHFSDYSLLAESGKKLYLLETSWKRTNSGYHECPFTINENDTIHLEKMIAPLSSTSESFLNDPSTNNVHIISQSSRLILVFTFTILSFSNGVKKTLFLKSVIGTENNYNFIDYTYSIGQEKIVNNHTLHLDIGVPNAYDADLKRFYFNEDGELVYIDASEKNGSLVYGKETTSSTLRMKGTIALSVSDKYYIAKKRSADRDFVFIVGSLDSSRSACIAKTKDYGLILNLYTDAGQDSVHRKLVRTIEPETITTVAPVTSSRITPKPSSSSSTILSSLSLFILPLLFYFNN